MREVSVEPSSPGPLRPEIGAQRTDRFLRSMRGLADALGGRAVWHVNSTSEGGGVAELLRPLVGYARGTGLDWRWATIDADESFFEITKRLHNLLHGHEGDGGTLGTDEHHAYDRALDPNAERLLELVGPGDLVVLHDPQTVGLTLRLRGAVDAVVWRCHIGVDVPNEHAARGRAFLRSYLEGVDVRVFSTEPHAWDGADGGRSVIIAPSIDPIAPKNQTLSADTAEAILRAAGVFAGEPAGSPTFSSTAGERKQVVRRARLSPTEPLPEDRPLVLQVSRWDRLKDPVGVIRGFADGVASSTDAHLVLAGPALDGVADDPEDDEAFAEVRAAVEGLAPEASGRVHVVELPMDDLDENGAIVNALQRRATVVVQKSLAEGFGLTVAEAMWKGRLVVASGVGGIRDQIEDGRSGLLLGDPEDLITFGALVRSALDGEARDGMGSRARERVLDRFLVTRELEDHATMIRDLLG